MLKYIKYKKKEINEQIAQMSLTLFVSTFCCNDILINKSHMHAKRLIKIFGLMLISFANLIINTHIKGIEHV